MLSLEKYIEQLKELQIRTAVDSLKPGETQKTEFHFGFVCGIKAGLDLALATLEAETQSNQEDLGGKNPTTRKR